MTFGVKSISFFNYRNVHVSDIEKYADHSTKSTGLRRTKRYALHERRIRSADVGVRVGYEVISAVDLAFTPNASTDGITIFQVNTSFSNSPLDGVERQSGNFKL